MTDQLAVLVPVLGRPHRVAPLLDSIRAATEQCRVLFLPDPHDDEERAAIHAAGAEELPTDGGYAVKINAGVRATGEPLIFLAADDLAFHPGWLEAATAAMTGPVEVVGVNDLIDRQREHSTHFLVTRRYAEQPTIDGAPGPVCEQYRHWYCDDELIATARLRGAYAYAPSAVVEHLHPFAEKAPTDATYQLGSERRRYDRRLFEQRQRLWM